MQQKVNDTIETKDGYRLDKQFFICLDDIFKKSDKSVVYSIDIWCRNIKYTFEKLDEFFDFSEKLTERIVKLRFAAKFPISESRIYTNDVILTFSNELDLLFSTQIDFDFNNNESYLLLKGKIESLLKTHKLAYSWLAETKIIPFLDLLTFLVICFFTWVNNIVFPEKVQTAILSLTFVVLVISVLPPIRRIKRFVFPHTEFQFGVNILLEKKAHTIRNIFGVTIILGLLVGIASSALSHFLFA